MKCRVKGGSTGVTKEARQERENNGLDKNHPPGQKQITRQRGVKRIPEVQLPAGRLLWEGWGEGGKLHCERSCSKGGSWELLGHIPAGSWRWREPAASDAGCPGDS